MIITDSIYALPWANKPVTWGDLKNDWVIMPLDEVDALVRHYLQERPGITIGEFIREMERIRAARYKQVEELLKKVA